MPTKTKKKAKNPKGCFLRDGIWWGKVIVNKKRHRWSLETDDRAQAKSRYATDAKRFKDMNYGDAVLSVKFVRAEWEVRYPSMRKKLGAKTMKRYVASLNQMPLLDELADIRDLDDDLITAIMESRADEDYVERSTIKNDMIALSSLCNYAVTKKYLKNNPVLPLLHLYQTSEKLMIIPDQRDIDIIRERAPTGIKWMMDGSMVTGCRQDELRRASTADIAPNKQLTVIGKGNKRRTIDLTPFDGHRVLTSIPAFVGSDVLFWHDDGEAYSNIASHFTRLQWETFCEFYDRKHGTTDKTRPSRTELHGAEDKDGWIDIGFRRFRFHDLRHVHAVRWLKSLHSIHALQKRLGHSSVQTTEMYIRAGFLTGEQELIVKGLVPAPAALAKAG